MILFLKQSSAGTVKLSDIATVSFMSSSFDVTPMRINGEKCIDVTNHTVAGG